VEGTVLVLVIHLEKQVGLLYGVNKGYCTGGNIKLLVANHETQFKISTFCTYYKTIKLMLADWEP
jgi:hypothetical protein